MNFIVGANGQGKTNLVEAIHFLSLARSFRTSNIKDLILWGERSCSVFGTLVGEGYDIELGVSIENGRKRTFLNKDAVSAVTDFIGKMVCVGFSPTDMALVKGAPNERRRLMDRHMAELNPAFMRVLVDYSRAIKNKNALLKLGGVKNEEIESWNQILSAQIVIIEAQRRQFIELLEHSAQKFHHQFADADGDLTLTLKSSVCLEEENLNETFILDRLNSMVEREKIMKACLVGPHRDDLIFKLAGKDARSFSSQGQARSIVLSLKLGVIELLEKTRGESPIILLDDVESELDSKRSGSFFEIILDQGRQVFITGTELREERIARHPDSAVWYIDNGVVAAHGGQQMPVSVCN